MKVLAVLEQRDGALRKVSHEVLAAARALADSSSGTVDALVLGAGTVTGIDQLGGFGADQVLLGTHADFALYSPDGASATIASIGGGYGAIVFAATAMGRDLAPRVAARPLRVAASAADSLGTRRSRQGEAHFLRCEPATVAELIEPETSTPSTYRFSVGSTAPKAR